MKFAKELDDDLVPEWRVKYFDYKQGKKKVKAVTRAFQKVNKSPKTPANSRTGTFKSGGTPTTPKIPHPSGYKPLSQQRSNGSTRTARNQADHVGTPLTRSRTEGSPAIPIPAAVASETHPLTSSVSRNRQIARNGTIWTRYGSIIGSPPGPLGEDLSRPATLNLPEPALESVDNSPANSPISVKRSVKHLRFNSHPVLPTAATSAFEVGRTSRPQSRNESLAGNHMRVMIPKQMNGGDKDSDRPLLKRIFTRSHAQQPSLPFMDVPLEAIQEVEDRQSEFWEFMDAELEKVEEFYKSKEEEATERLEILRSQLHIMRDQRLEEMVAKETATKGRRRKDSGELKDSVLAAGADTSIVPSGWNVIYHPIEAVKKVGFAIEPHKEMAQSRRPSHLYQHAPWRDYVRRPDATHVAYATAKRRLKIALIEFYRGLELLKGYALLNRTAFRKMNKKYDKAVSARPTMRFMSNKVNHADFVESDLVDKHIAAVEDLYARYFESGNHKIAVGKLRRRNPNAGSYTGGVFRNGFMIAGGLVFGIEGLVYARNLLNNTTGMVYNETSYLLQLYAGYFLMLTLFLFFAVDCKAFNAAKVNYSFVFEFDARSVLDWRQLAEIPCVFFFALGLTLWLNFARVGGEVMYIYWPVILIGLTTIVIFLPAPILYHQSRRWIVVSLWRLLGAGIYPVEFRDFFLGDMFCSLTYSMGNVELFFCLYANRWNNPSQCNSSNSRLQGFFTTLPGIWRALQCLRRYKDTKNAFPHLANGLKYTFTILAAMSLSLYRIHKYSELRALFIVFATINAVYCSVWDLVMDWSLGNFYAPHRFLRLQMAYKRPWYYYAAMILDPILRFNWIFYAIFSHEVQHSAILSFFVAISEIIRRGIWVLFRVENEHCTNVTRFRAQRDVPLPYHLQEAVDSAELLRQEEVRQGTAATRSPPSSGNGGLEAGTTGADVDPHRGESALASLRRRHEAPSHPPQHTAAAGFASRFARIIHGAHAQDFERKRKSAAATPEEGSEDDEEDEEEEEDEDEDGGRVPDQEEVDEEMVEAERTAGQLGESVSDAARLDQEQTLGVRQMARREREDV